MKFRKIAFICGLMLAGTQLSAMPLATVINAELDAVWVSPDGQFVLAGGRDATLLRSMDAGMHWQQARMPSPFVVDQLAGDNAGDFLALGEQGLLHSRDKGEHWTPTTLPANSVPSRVLFDPNTHQWFATNAKGGMLFSQDGGQSWKNVAGIKKDAPLLILSLTARGHIIAAGMNGEIVYSKDRKTWVHLQANVGAHIARLLPLAKDEGTLAVWADGSTSLISPEGRWLKNAGSVGDRPPTVVSYDAKHHLALVGNLDGKVLTSSDLGKTWQSHTIIDKIFLSGLTVSPQTGKIIATGGAGTVAESADGGNSWKILRGNEPTSRLQELAASADAKTLYAVGTGGMIVRSQDYGEHWRALREDTNQYVGEIASSADNKTLVAVGAYGLMVRSDDDGQSWHAVNSNLPIEVTFKSVILNPRDNAFWVSGAMGSVTYSLDNGLSWHGTQSMPDAGDGFFRQIVTNEAGSTLLLAANPGKVMRSVDNGASWHATDADTSDPGIDQIIPVGAQTFIAIRGDGQTLRSTDDGQHWAKIVDTGAGTSGIYAEPEKNLVWVMGQGKVFRSADRGEHWQESSLNGVTLNYMLRSQSGTLLGFGNFGALVRSTDNGVTWSRVNSGVKPSLRKPLQDPKSGRIYVPGREGTLLYSDNDGLKWEKIDLHTEAHVNRLWLDDAGKVLVVTGEKIIRVDL